MILGPIPIGLGAATDLFCAAKAAEGASPRTVEWHRMIVGRAVRRFGEARPVDAIPAAEKVFGKASGGFAVDPRLALDSVADYDMRLTSAGMCA